jgi:diguanylate cyclase (GGDEF)-like protein
VTEADGRQAGWLENQPLQTKLRLALGLVLAVFVVGTVAALVAQDEANRARTARSEAFGRVVALDRLMRSVVDQQLSLRGYVISGDKSFLDRHDDGREQFTRQLGELRGELRGNPLQLTRLSQVSALMDRYWERVADPMLGWMERAPTRPRAVSAVATGQDGLHIDEMRRELETIQATELGQLELRTRHSEATALRTQWILLGVLVSGVLLGVLALLMVRWQITTPLVRLAGLMERLAAQDHRIEVPDQARRDEVGAIARALAVFKRMAQATASETWVKSGVAAVAARLHEARDWPQFARAALDELAPRLDATVAAFWRYDPETRQLQRVASLGLGGDGQPELLRLGEGPVGDAARSRRPEVLPHHYPVPPALVGRPVASGESLLGVIELGRAGRPELRHELLLNELAPILALSLESLLNALRVREAGQELERANQALREKSDLAHHQATHDALTGVPNRLLFMDRLEQAIERARRNGTIFGLCYVDIDGFKPVNDRHGHDAGDALLIAIAGRLQETLRRSDTVARLGGDEFVLLMIEPESETQALAVVERLCRRLAEPYMLEGPTLPEPLVVEVGASIGLSVYPRDARTVDGLMKAADAAMYAAKQSGKNRVVRAGELAGAAHSGIAGERQA